MAVDLLDERCAKSRLQDCECLEETRRSTSNSLNKDFLIGESMQVGLGADATEHMTFGDLVSALPKSDGVVKRCTLAHT